MHRMWDWLILVLYLAIIFVLVRPGSQGPSLVDRIGTTLIGLVNAGTGGGGWSGRR
jgi:hypothetical protein